MHKLKSHLTEYRLVIHDEMGTETRREVIQAVDDEDAKKKARGMLKGREGCKLTTVRTVWEFGALSDANVG